MTGAITFPNGNYPAGTGIVHQGKPLGIYLPGDQPFFTIQKWIWVLDFDQYTVRDITGAVVSQGTIDSSGDPATLTVNIAAPAGNWKLGWYRVHFRLKTPDTTNGYGRDGADASFCIVSPGKFALPPDPLPARTPGSNNDPWAKYSMGTGSSRWEVNNTLDPTADINIIKGDLALTKTNWLDPAKADGVRKREPWVAFTNVNNDQLELHESTDTYVALNLLEKDVAGPTTSVTVTAGTASGNKIVLVRGGVTETYDNLATYVAAHTALLASAFIIPAHTYGPGFPWTLKDLATTNIPRVRSTGIKTAVQALYPDVKWYEGPVNEPGMHTQPPLGASLVPIMNQFADAVHGAVGGEVYLDNDFTAPDETHGNAVQPKVGPLLVDQYDLSRIRGNRLWLGGHAAENVAWDLSAHADFAFTFTTTGAGFYGGIQVRQQADGSHINWGNNGNVIFFHDGTFEVAAQGDAGRYYDQPGEWTIECIGSVIKTYKNGTLIKTMSAPSNTAGGKVYLNSGGAGEGPEYMIDSVRATQTAGKAYVMGPCPVDISNLGAWEAFLAAGGAAKLDGISFHDYNNITGGNINVFRSQTEAFLALLQKYNQHTKPRWQTEAGTSIPYYAGVAHHARALTGVLHKIMWEQYGIPFERNMVWYDNSHGFWAFPAWLHDASGSTISVGPMYRQLAWETHQCTFVERLRFGTIGDQIFVGSRYEHPSGYGGGGVVVLAATTALHGATVTLNVTGSTPNLTVSDAQGNSSQVPVTNGKITVPVTGPPTYIRYQNGISFTVDKVWDWAPVAKDQPASRATVVQGGDGRLAPVLADGEQRPFYLGGTQGTYLSLDRGMPDTVTLKFDVPQRFDRVMVFSGEVVQLSSALLDYDVQTSDDGLNWTTRATVNKVPPEPVNFKSSTFGSGTSVETWYDECWVDSVRLSAPVVAQYLRLYVRKTTYGGEADQATQVRSVYGGPTTMSICLQEVSVVCDANAEDQFLR